MKIYVLLEVSRYRDDVKILGLYQNLDDIFAKFPVAWEAQPTNANAKNDDPIVYICNSINQYGDGYIIEAHDLK